MAQIGCPVLGILPSACPKEPDSDQSRQDNLSTGDRAASDAVRVPDRAHHPAVGKSEVTLSRSLRASINRDPFPEGPKRSRAGARITEKAPSSTMDADPAGVSAAVKGRRSSSSMRCPPGTRWWCARRPEWRRKGMTAAFLPRLFGQPGKPRSVGYTVREILKALCVRREFEVWRPTAEPDEMTGCAPFRARHAEVAARCRFGMCLPATFCPGDDDGVGGDRPESWRAAKVAADRS